MTTMSRKAQSTARWMARGVSTLAAAFWLLILLDILACDALVGFIRVNWEMALLVVFVAASVLSVIIAWRKEGVGGLVMLLWGIIFTVFAAIDSRNYWVISMLVSGVPFLIAGLLFLASWRLSLRAASTN
jgi:hypothetical protein